MIAGGGVDMTAMNRQPSNERPDGLAVNLSPPLPKRPNAASGTPFFVRTRPLDPVPGGKSAIEAWNPRGGVILVREWPGPWSRASDIWEMSASPTLRVTRAVRSASRAMIRRPVGDGYQAALINFAYMANAVLSTDEVVKAMG